MKDKALACPLEQMGVRAGRGGISLLPVSPEPAVRLGGPSSQPCREKQASPQLVGSEEIGWVLGYWVLYLLSEDDKPTICISWEPWGQKAGAQAFNMDGSM